ncbi:FUSC family protein [Lichenihabitans sp. PAMC28606]|uniref:FUSC family protein n=1 Tax=Lichenihabitans sp. PAMC28606 TaxID=2880932 RepID=UPI001D0B4945|nr:FUSC family protein [Lichenihabitans sp. PAMC28606]UDL95767.1 FUSC family protein [Lichenihabitans sp. PAMC28606]
MADTAAAPSHLRPERIRDAVVAAAPALLFGLRLALGVSLALYLAFFLQLDNPSWAGTSAAIVAQPVLGASMRKGVFRLVGTIIGAIATVALTAVFPQDRVGFLLGLALWCAACSFVSTVLRNFSAYAAMLAGYTMAIIASSSIAAPDQVFTLAVARAAEISLGIACGMVVMSVTDFGHSPRRLAASVSALVADIGAGVGDQLRGLSHLDRRDLQTRRRALLKRVAALDPLIDQTIGESPGISDRRSTLRAGITGLFLALSAWRTISVHIDSLEPVEGQRQAHALLKHLPPDLGTLLPQRAEGATDAEDLVQRFKTWESAAATFRDADGAVSTSRLGLDRIASVLEGLNRAVNVEILLTDSRRARPINAVPQRLISDVLPPLVNALRVFAALSAASMVYVLTSWSAGPTFITFVAVTVILLSPQNEQASSAIIGFAAGSVLTAALAAVIKFAVLPNHEGYGSFAAIIFLVLVPLAALSTRPALAPVLIPATVNFIPLLGPTNLISYDMQSFANSALAIMAGCIGGAVVLQVMPPVPPATRTRRLVGLTLADLRAIARHPGHLSPDRWRSRVFARIVALPADADPADGSSMLGALTVGLQLMDVRETFARFGLDLAAVGEVEAAVSKGDLADIQSRLDTLRRVVADRFGDANDSVAISRLLAAFREIGETITNYRDYFGAVIR